MKKLRRVLIFLFAFGQITIYKAQNPEWKVYTNCGDSIYSLANEGDSLWIGLRGAIVILDKLTGESTFYTLADSGFSYDIIQCIVIDDSGNKWISDGESGLRKFDGIKWTVYNTSNSGLPNNFIYAIALDGYDTKWIGTGRGGLVKFDGEEWTIYNTPNSRLTATFIRSLAIDSKGKIWIADWLFSSSLILFDGSEWVMYDEFSSGLPTCQINCISIDSKDIKWIGTSAYRSPIGTSYYPAAGLVKFGGTSGYSSPIHNGYCSAGGLVKFDGTNWTIYDTANSQIPDNDIFSIVSDSDDNIWMGTRNGVAKFDGINWITYDTLNSGLPNNCIRSFTIDNYGNKWIGTEKGLAVFHEGGIVSVKESENKKVYYPDKFVLYQNYPNPFNPTTKIKYDIQAPPNLPKGEALVQLKIYDILGREISTLVNKEQQPGTYEFQFDGSNLPSGVYFYRLQAGSFSDTKKLVLLK